MAELERRERGYEMGRLHAATWGAVTAEGVLLVALGVLAIIASAAAGLVSIVFLGALFIVAGVSEVVGAFRHRSHGFGASFLGGALSAIVGGLLVARPATGLATLTLLIGLYFFASGIFRGLTSVIDRYRHWGWDFAYAAISVVLGLMVLRSWPVSSLWLVGTLVGIELVSRGFTWIAGGLAIRKIGHAALDPLGPRTPRRTV